MKTTAASTSMLRLPSAMAVAWNAYVGAVGLLHPAKAAGPVEGGDPPVMRPGGGDGAAHPQWTILERGSSKMSVAPWSRRAGISVLMPDLATTVSSA